jgi:hypothetical protein
LVADPRFFTRSADRLHGIFAGTEESPSGKKGAASGRVEIGLGRTSSLALLAALSFFVALRVTSRPE